MDEYTFKHVKDRLKERHNLKLTINEIKSLNLKIRQGDAKLLDTHNNTRVFEVYYNDIPLIVYFQKKHITTVLPKQNKYHD